jgi:2-desacetyl-2-hydroxyethyl bacteriochlorophyllide A dehydrogenase
MKRTALIFTAPGQVRLAEEELAAPAPDQVQVHSLMSAISTGTEMLVYRGQLPDNLKLDETIPELQQNSAYPLKYGYSLVGRVSATGQDAASDWMNRLVFAFHPHESAFNASPQSLIPLPQGVAVEDAVFLANMETAVNLLMDGQPRIGERVAVFGQGIVGLLTTALLAYFPLAQLTSFEPLPARRQASLAAGAHACVDPSETGMPARAFPDGADLTYELSGTPSALEQAIKVTGFSGRVVVGSWYGRKRASLDLGSHFHRSRLHLISSQVSTIDPQLSGRWTKERRFSVAWDMLRAVRPSRWITHQVPFRKASQAFDLLDRSPEACIQAVLQYT